MVARVSGAGDARSPKAASKTPGSQSRNFTVSTLWPSAACPIALLVGDLAAAEHYARMLLDRSTRHGLAHWRAFGRFQQGVLAIERGDLINGLRLLRAGLDELGGNRSALPFVATLMARSFGPGRPDL